MSRTEAYLILTKYLKNPNLLKHSLACEAAMKMIYKKITQPPYDPDVEQMWGITGLLHDADYEMTAGKPEIHGIYLFQKEPMIPKDIEYAIKAHNPRTSITPKSQMDWAIRTVDQLTGLIVAATLVHPDKKLASITPEFVLNRLHEKTFAKGADRTQMKLCEEKLGIPLNEFVAITLLAMQGISNDLHL